MRSGYWQDLTTEDFAEVDPEGVIALLPVAAVEQHGPHLPLSTDSAICNGLVTRLLARVPEELILLVLPALPVGCSPEHAAFPGTLTASPETLIRLWTEVGVSVARSGVRKLVILNTHGGQPQIVDIVAQRLRVEQAMLVVKANSFALGLPAGLFDVQEVTYGIHAGGIETSLMMALHPDLVRGDKVADFEPTSVAMARDYARLNTGGPAKLAWATQDLHPSGACGNAMNADAPRGEQVLDHMVDELRLILRDVRRFPLSALRER